jgi:hypothetical protein
VNQESLSINKSSFKLLKEEYNKAVESKLNSFIFQDKEILTGYAKYLIEYLENEFKDGK